MPSNAASVLIWILILIVVLVLIIKVFVPLVAGA